MITLRNYHHDFARLAKQSGYYFQLHRGRVNWSEIDNLSIKDIYDNRNFVLLEENLVNVVNCNLEQEYDFKVLDKNFVKLFKLAQLGVDYLSYCVLYLDRCVVLLQEQLNSCQQECESLRKEISKKNEELQDVQSISKAQSFQCNKCEKIFISEIYLRCHEKRRHCNVNTPKSGHATKKFTDKSQQTDEDRMIFSKNIQVKETGTETNDILESEEIIKIKQENNMKMEKMEKELEELKGRLKKAETTLSEKIETPSSNAPPMNFSGPIMYPPILPFVPTYLQTQPLNNFYEVNSGYQTAEHRQISSPIVSDNLKTNNFISNKANFSNSVENINYDYSQDVPKKEEMKTVNEKNTWDKARTHRNSHSNKENINPNKELPLIKTKPLPLPRQSKRMFETVSISVDKVPESITKTMDRATKPETEGIKEDFRMEKTVAEDVRVDEDFVEDIKVDEVVADDITEKQATTKVVQFTPDSIPCSSTPKKDTPEKSTDNPKPAEQSDSQETLLIESKPSSFIKKIVSRNSPKLQDISKNIRRSLTNLYDSMSTGKDLGKVKETTQSNLREAAVDGLNAHLKELGVDPEWSGIPKKTMKQKLKILQFRRKLLAKENPTYPTVRRRLERSVFKKLNKLKNVKREVDLPPSNEQESIETHSSEVVNVFNAHDNSSPNSQNSKLSLKLKKPTMYDIETSSDTDAEPPNILPTITQNHQRIDDSVDIEELDDNSIDKKEVDFSVFQIHREKNSKPIAENKSFANEVQSDSDFDDEFFTNFENEHFKTTTYFGNTTRTNDKPEGIKGETSKSRLDPLVVESEKLENQSILKKSTQTNQSKSPFPTTKKVLFAENVEKNKSNAENISKLVKDIWSSESDWDEEIG